MKKDAKTFNHRMGRWLKQLRINRALSQADVAQAIGVHRNRVSGYERGVGMTLWIYLEIARALGVPAELPPNW